jgi:hypothetical protein
MRATGNLASQPKARTLERSSPGGALDGSASATRNIRWPRRRSGRGVPAALPVRDGVGNQQVGSPRAPVAEKQLDTSSALLAVSRQAEEAVGRTTTDVTGPQPAEAPPERLSVRDPPAPTPAPNRAPSRPQASPPGRQAATPTGSALAAWTAWSARGSTSGLRRSVRSRIGPFWFEQRAELLPLDGTGRRGGLVEISRQPAVPFEACPRRGVGRPRSFDLATPPVLITRHGTSRAQRIDGRSQPRVRGREHHARHSSSR